MNHNDCITTVACLVFCGPVGFDQERSLEICQYRQHFLSLSLFPPPAPAGTLNSSPLAGDNSRSKVFSENIPQI